MVKERVRISTRLLVTACFFKAKLAWRVQPLWDLQGRDLSISFNGTYWRKQTLKTICIFLYIYIKL